MSSQALTLEYRPVTFQDMVGQKAVKAILQAMVKSGNMPPALILGGVRGTGKTTSARILAAALNCHDQTNGDACGTCPSCKSVQMTTSLSVLEIDAASNGGVEEVRKIKDICQYAHEGEWRLVLLDEAHSMSKPAFNALLKILEEPPMNTVFVLLTTEVDKILDTVRSRSMSFEFRRISMADITGRLRHIADSEGINAEDGLLHEIAQSAQGGMRDAVMLLDQVRRIGLSTAEQYRKLFGVQDVSEDILKAAVAGDMAAGSKIIGDQYRRTGDAVAMTTGLTALIRDLLIVRAGGSPDCDEERLGVRSELAAQIDQRALVRIITVLWDLQSRLSHFTTDHRSAMEMAFVLISEAATGKTPSSQTAKQAPASEKLTLKEMESMWG